MSAASAVLGIPELYSTIAVYLSATDAYNFFWAIGQQFTEFDRRLLHTWRDYFHSLSWTRQMIRSLHDQLLDAEVLMIGPHVPLPATLSPTRTHAAYRQEVAKLELPYLNIFVLINNQTPRLSFREKQQLACELMDTVRSKACEDNGYIVDEGQINLRVITFDECAPLVNYPALDPKDSELKMLPPSQGDDPPPMGYIWATKGGVKTGTLEKTKCYCVQSQNMYITVGGIEGRPTRYTTYEICRAPVECQQRAYD